jgi:hypothetical protein
MAHVTITEDMARQAAWLTERGTPLKEVAINWGISPEGMYAALKRYGIQIKRTKTTPAEHVAHQQASNLPPEVYALRAELSPETLRRYAWESGKKLAINTFAERKAWWLEKFDTFSPINARAFCQLNNLPVPMVAHWYHRLHDPKELLLWGFNQLHRVNGEQFTDYVRFAVARADLYAIGQGKSSVPIEARIATEAYRFATPLVTH